MYLHCHSFGDRRFCARYAQLPTTGETILWHYTEKLRDKDRTLSDSKDFPPPYLALNYELIPATRELCWHYYLMLWKCYFEDRPDLWELACSYDGFYEEEGSPTIHYASTTRRLPYREPCSDAVAIAYLVGHALQLPADPGHNLCVEESYRRYRNTFPIAS